MIMYFSMMAWSYLAYKVTECSIWTIFAYYMLGMVGFYFWHYMAHSEWAGEMHEIHMEHHIDRFPPSDFYGTAELYADMYPEGRPTIWGLMNLAKTTNIADGTKASSEGAGTTNEKQHTPLAHEGPMLLMQLMIVIGGVYWWGTKWSTMGFVCVMYLAIGSIGNALHMSFHVRNFHLEKYAWYRELRTLHYIHHLGDMKSNMGMLNLVLVDGLTGSLQTRDPVKNRVSNDTVFTGLKNRADKDFPEGITPAAIKASAQHAGFTATVLGLDVPLCTHAVKCARDS